MTATYTNNTYMDNPQGATPNCPKCNGPMHEAKKYSATSPDFKCNNVTCKFKKVKGQWVASTYPTGYWMPTEPHVAQAPDDSQEYPPQPFENKVTPLVAKQTAATPPDADTWERKDRTSMAQTAAKAAADIHQATGDSEAMMIDAEVIYSWISGKRG